jgi:quercetin dioxygenase-like cupin family protein
VVEVGEGEAIFLRDELSVTLLVDVEQIAAVDVRAAPGWGTTPPHVHVRHGEALYVREGELVLRLDDRVERIGPETWAFVPPGVAHTVETSSDTPARYLVFHTPNSGYGDYVRGDVAHFDQRPAADYVPADPGLTIVRRAGGASGVGSTEPPKSGGPGFAGAGAGTGETITDQPNRRATLLVDADELTVSEFLYGAGERGAQPHVHHEHADAFLVVQGEFALHNRDGTLSARAGTLVVFPPDVVHGFDNDSDAPARCFNFHMPASGFADYLRTRNPAFDQHDPPEDGGVDPSAIIAVSLSK